MSIFRSSREAIRSRNLTTYDLGHHNLARKAFVDPRRLAVTASIPTDAPDALRILVVEDDSVIGFLLSEMLADLGHEVCGIERTENGAVDAARRMKPDFMIVDAKLAAGTGAGVMARVLRTGPMPHVFMSGLPITRMTTGAASLLKPFSEKSLIRGIADGLASH